MIAQLAKLLRYALESADEDLVPLEEELAFTRSYLSLASKRFGDRLDVEFDIAPETQDSQLPPMVLQPLVENAIRHGIGPSERGGTVRIATVRRDGEVEVDVEDTGVGIRDGEWDRLMDEGIGLKNTDGRLRTLFGDSHGLALEPNDPSGLRVRFSIPFRTSESAQEHEYVHRR